MALTTIQGGFLGADLVSAQTALTSGLATTDEIIVSDAGVIKRMDISVIEIAASQITASGTLPALNGAALTALTAANITASGTLPALNGAALTALTAANITASGTLPALNGAALTALNGSNIASGTVAVARLGSGSPGSGNFLRGDGSWQTAGGIASVLADTTPQLGGNLDMQARLLVGNGGSTGIAISTNGEVTMAAQPGFLAHAAADQNNGTGDGTPITIVYGTEIFDQNADFDGVSTFTSPVAGRYIFIVETQLLQLASGHIQCVLSLITPNRTYTQALNPYASFDATATYFSPMTIVIADMGASEAVTFQVDVAGGAKSVDIGSGISTRFSGWLLG
jgi:hypothetical protein